MTVPDLQTAEALLLDAEAMNPGRWVPHTRNVALAARVIAEHHPHLDPERAYVLGLLHDIGRRTGPNADRHILDGHDHLMRLGYADAARIALTHSFPGQRVDELIGAWDGTAQEFGRLEALLLAAQYTEEDRLIQLCDLLALPEGCCVMEKRLVDIALRYGFTPQLLGKWRAQLALKAHFDGALGRNLYFLLPGIVETTLG
ncbi:HD domain-containing protein [Deinococcus aquiradiocola]|uniref:Metal-dependent phosphohydrolase n=1 Tax=Deinococcus aquiradiocola TaxID=393059 RepID=A0A917PNA8_9DEIO|nr:HD domain-containing protein [Deinococcus aquiradiocola]GGJ85138.1 metal-dependent phosphohydrolase [Deinococcus aquiradiocola]